MGNIGCGYIASICLYFFIYSRDNFIICILIDVYLKMIVVLTNKV